MKGVIPTPTPPEVVAHGLRSAGTAAGPPAGSRVAPAEFDENPEAAITRQSIRNTCLATYLDNAKESIITEWVGRVRADPAISATDILNTTAVKNHLPEMFNDLTASLRNEDSGIPDNNSGKDAAEHGAARMMQGYELSEMLREIKHLRVILILHLRLFEEQYSDNSMPVRLHTSTSLHTFLDQLMIDATEEFLWAKMSLQERVHLGYIRC